MVLVSSLKFKAQRLKGGSEGCQSSWICQPSLTLNRVWSNPASRPAKNRTERQKTSLNRTQKVNTAELHPPVNLSWLIDSRRERKPPRLFESKTQFRFSPAPCSPCAPGTPAQVFAGLPALVCCGWTVTQLRVYVCMFVCFDACL